MVLERSDTKIKGYVCMYRCSAFRMFVYVKSLRGAFLKARKNNWGGGGGGSLKSPELVKWTAPPWRRDENLSDINIKQGTFIPPSTENYHPQVFISFSIMIESRICCF